MSTLTGGSGRGTTGSGKRPQTSFASVFPTSSRSAFWISAAGGHEHPTARRRLPRRRDPRIDIAAPMLRYGHARSEALGTPIHLSQQNAVETDYDDQSFDLVLSNLLFHETPQKVSREIRGRKLSVTAFRRITVHNDMIGWPTDPFEEFMTA